MQFFTHPVTINTNNSVNHIRATAYHITYTDHITGMDKSVELGDSALEPCCLLYIHCTGYVLNQGSYCYFGSLFFSGLYKKLEEMKEDITSNEYIQLAITKPKKYQTQQYLIYKHICSQKKCSFLKSNIFLINTRILFTHSVLTHMTKVSWLENLEQLHINPLKTNRISVK